MKASHLQRWITGIIAVPVLFCLIYFSNPAIFAVLISAVIVIAAWEYESIINAGKAFSRRWEFSVLVLLVPVAAYLQEPTLSYTTLVMSVMILILCDLYRTNRMGKTPEISLVSKYILGLVYIPVLMSHLILIRQWETGVYWVFFILVIAFSGDIAAFYTGKYFGKIKLCPAISPNKTTEGVLGLVAGAVSASGAYGYFFLSEIPLQHVLIIAFIASIVGQLGDLFESEIKRGAGIKDSGIILPGHGGMLDRVDCLLFMIPFVYYYRMYLLDCVSR